jgi:hypothetical protein
MRVNRVNGTLLVGQSIFQGIRKIGARKRDTSSCALPGLGERQAAHNVTGADHRVCVGPNQECAGIGGRILQDKFLGR